MTVIRTAVRTTLCTAAVSVLVGASALSPASAHEPRTHPLLSAASAWSTPVAALGGDALAVYLANHEAREFPPPGV
jgi:hypothetical protein